MKKFFVLFFTIFLAALFISCEIGLGESVDTESPKITITSPEPDSIIRDAFRFSGTWSDDGNIRELKVKLERTDGLKVEYEPFTGIVNSVKGKNEIGEWYCVVNPLDEEKPILDGTYVATVSITDEGEHTTIQTRQFTIDNTAPVVILQRPSTKTGSTSFDTYGQKLTIEGQAADDTNIDHIDVLVYEDENFTNLLKTVTLKNVPPTISLDFADLLDEKSNNYADIYQSSEFEGTKNRYCTIKVYDDAQCIPVDGSEQTAEDKLGNYTEEYYLRADLSADILMKYKVTEIYHMLNGTYTVDNNSREALKDNLIETLATKAIKSSQFSMNPDNSPSFVVSGKSILEGMHTLEDDEFQITSGNTSVEVQIDPGLDNIAINPDTIGIYLQECNRKGQLIDDAEKIWLVKQYKNKQGDILLTDEEFASRIVPKVVSSSYKFKTPYTISPNNIDGVVIGKYYRIVVVGSDAAGNDVSNGSIYAFKLASSGEFVELGLSVKPSNVSANPKANAENKKISVTLTYNGPGPFAIYRNDDWEPFTTQPANTSTYVDENISTIDPDSSTIIQKDEYGRYYISYRIQGSGDAKSNVKTVILPYDNDAPVISKIEYPTTADTELGSFRFTGKASDGDTGSGIDKVFIQISDGTNSTGDIRVSGTEEWYKDIKIAEYADSHVFDTEGPKKVEIWAVDKVGIKSNATDSDSGINTTWIYDRKNPILSGLAYRTLKDDGEYNPITLLGTNSEFNTGKVFSITGLVEDGYGIKSVVVTQKKNDGEEKVIYTSENELKLLALPRKESTPTQETADLPSEGQNTYVYTIKVTDKADKVAEKTIRVTIDKEAPSVTLGALPKASDTKATVSSYAFIGTAADSGTGVKEINLTISDVKDSTKTKTVKVEGTQNWIYSLKYSEWSEVFETEGEKKVELKAIDNAGNESSNFDYEGEKSSVIFIYDKNNPESTLTGTQEYIPAGGYIIKGTAKDTYDLDKIRIVQTKDKSDPITYEIPLAEEDKNIKEKNWQYTIPQGDITDGEYEFTVEVCDKVGNEKQVASFSSIVDTTAPEITVVSPNNKTGINSINSLEKTDYGFNGTIVEEKVVNAVYYQILAENAEIPAKTDKNDVLNAEKWGELGWTAAASSKTSWNFTQSFKAKNESGSNISEGKYKLYLVAVDGAGNISDISTTAFDVDMAVPEVTETESTAYVNLASAGKVKLGGAVTETNELSSFVIKRNGFIVSQDVPESTWSFEGTPGDGTYVYEIIATDVAGKTNTTLTRTIVVDTKKPQIDLTKVVCPTSLDTENSLFKFEGKADCVKDEGVSSGFDKVEMAFTTNETTKPENAEFTFTPADNGSWNATVEFSKVSAFANQGVKYLWLKAYDKAGNDSDWVSKEFVYDTEKPSISLTTAPAEKSYTNTNTITISGTADDSYEVDKVTIFNGENKLEDADYDSEAKTWTKTITLDTDDNYSLNIVVIDKSEKTNKITRSFTVDTKAPEGSFNDSKFVPSYKYTSADSKKWYNSSSIKFNVTVTDANIETVEGSIDGVNFQVFSKVGQTTEYQGTLVMNSGENTVYVKMTDKANNSATTTEKVYVDTTNPSLEAPAEINKYMPAAGLTLSGKASDSLNGGISSGAIKLTVKEYHKAENGEYTETEASKSAENGQTDYSTVPVNNVDKTWSLNVPLNLANLQAGTPKAGEPEEGKYKYVFTLVDAVGNSVSTKEFETTVDTIAPSLVVTTTGDITETYPKFTGTFTEDVELKNVYYGFTLETENETNVTSWKTATKSANKGTDKDWSFYQNFTSGTGDDIKLGEGKYKLWVYAEDEAGNKSNVKSFAFNADMELPAVTQTNTDVYSTSSVTLNGKITETNKLSSFEIFRDNEAQPVKSFTLETEIPYKPSNTSWKFTDSNPGDGEHVYKIVATDVAGRENIELKKTIIVDSTEPKINAKYLTLPKDRDTENKLFKFEGNTGILWDGDAGVVTSGWDKVELGFTNGSSTEPAAVAATSIPAADGSFTATVEFSTVEAFATEGTKYVWLKAYDKAKNNSGWVNVYKNDSNQDVKCSFVYDTETPKISFEAGDGTINPGDNTYRNTGFTLKVKAEDTYGIQSIKVTPGNFDLTKDSGTDKSGVWSKDFTVGSGKEIEDGEHTFTITVTDKSGKTNTVTRKFTTDTVEPAFTENEVNQSGVITTLNNGIIDTPINIAASGQPDDNWFNTATLNVKITADGGTTAISKLEISKDGGVNYTIVSTSATGTGIVTCDNQGTNSIVVKATDQAGNSRTKVYSVKIDSDAPTTATITQIDSETNAEKLKDVKLVNGLNDIDVYINVMDANSTETGKFTGIKAVKLLKIGSKSAVNSSTGTEISQNNWKVIINKKDLDSGAPVFEIEDKVGNKYNYFADFQIQLDNIYPSAEITNYPSAVNKEITLGGIASDNNKLDSVKLQYTTSTKNADSSFTDGTTWTDVAVTGTTSWTANINTESLTDTAWYAFRAVAKDSALNEGNSGEARGTSNEYSASKVLHLQINQDSDRPVINITNLSFADGNKSESYFWHKRSEMYGTVEDDDGAVKEVKVIIKDTTIPPTADEWTAAENLYKNGGWSFEFVDSSNNVINGSKQIFFQVKDGKDGVFTSNTTSTTKTTYGPKITGSDKTVILGTSGKISDIVPVKIDTQEPTITPIYYRTTDPGVITAEKLSNPASNGWTDILALSGIFGGDNSALWVMVTAQDDNGISASKVKFGTKTINVNRDSTVDADIIYNNNSTESSHVYIVKFVTSDKSVVTSGTQTLQIEATDNAKTRSTRQFSLTVDNIAPTIENFNIAANENVYGSMPVQLSGSISEKSRVYFAISKDESTQPDDDDFERIDEYTNSSTSWTIRFNNEQRNETPDQYSMSYPTEYLNKYVEKAYNITLTQSDTTVRPVTIWMYAIDDIGNRSNFVKHTLKVTPLGDKPTVEISYPGVTDETLGGTIRMNGSATIAASGVDSVWIQIDPNYNGSSFSRTWYSDLQSLMTANNVTNYSITATPKYTDSEKEEHEITFPDNITHGIKATGTSSWNITLNQAKEFNSQVNGANRKVAIRVIAVSATGKISEVEEVEFTVDPNSPLFGQYKPLELVQYEENHIGESDHITARKAYVADMWLKGQWYLTGSVEDDSGISQINYSENDGIPENIVGDSEKVTAFEDTEDGGSGNKGYLLNIPVGDTAGAFGSKEYSIEIYDNTSPNPNRNNIAIRINYDNTDPVFSAQLKDSGNEIAQSNGTYTINGTLKEEGANNKNQSGFNRIAMFFTRKINNIDYIVDPMISAGTTDGNDNRYALSDFKEKESLYWRKISGASVSNKKITVTIPDSSYANIRKGGLVMVDNVAYVISNVVATENTDEYEISVDETLTTHPTTDVYFALAQIIDHLSVEGGTTSVYKQNPDDSTVTNDDNDQMVEGVTRNGTTYDWTVSINSLNIYDGPITMNFVAFDKAGNKVFKSYTGNIANNAPRIAGVMYGTDENGNGSVEDDELIKIYHNRYATGTLGITENGRDEYKRFVTNFISEAKLNIKGAFKIKPEIVGGNTGLGYSYDYKDEKGKTISQAYTSYDEEVGHSATTEVRDSEKLAIELKVLDLLTKGIPNYGENTTGAQRFEFTFWDKTEGTAQGVDSNKAIITIPVEVQFNDGESPTNVINPFHWTSNIENSVYNGKGHIELEEDLPGEIFKETGGVFDSDPKVSGIISIDGKAFDNILVNELQVKITGYNGGNYFSIAKRDTSGNWTGTGDIDNGWSTEITSDVSNQEGNTVDWKLNWDTSKVDGVALEDVQVVAKAIDRGAAVLNSDKTDVEYKDALSSDDTSTDQTVSTGKTCFYQMDVVPYIISIERNSTYNTNRARSGAVPLLRGETLNKITGFNIATTTNSSLKIAKNKDGTETPVEMTSLAVSGSDLTFTVPAAANSGYLHLVVNNVPALNNMNAYQTYNEETNAKAYDHNTLTDDRYVLIWRVSAQDTFKGSKNSVHQAMSRGPDGTLYASFDNYGMSNTYYANSFKGDGTLEVATGATLVYSACDPAEGTDIFVGADGNVNVIINGSFLYNSGSPWNGTSNNAGGLFISDSVAPAISSHGTGNQNLWRGELYTYDDELMQFNGMRVNRFAGEAGNYVNYVYYDRLANAVKYSFIPASETPTDNLLKTDVTFIKSGSYYVNSPTTDEYNGLYIKIDDTYHRITRRGTYYTTQYNIEGVTANSVSGDIYGILNTNTYGSAWVTIDGNADKLDITGTTEDTNDKFTFATSWKPFSLTETDGCWEEGISRTTGTGESVALTTNKNGYAVILYMDAGTGQLRIARANSVTPNAAENWKVQGVFTDKDPNYETASDYMSCAVDSEGFLHIAFQNTKGQLVYAISTNTPDDGNTAYTFGSSEVLDDSGMWIDMTMDGTTPYISYLSRVNSYDGMKLAFFDSTFDADNDGTADGGWETMTAPLNAKVTNVRSCVEVNAKAYDGNSYQTAIGFCPGADYRAAFFTGK